jgi:hypothetical protein
MHTLEPCSEVTEIQEKLTQMSRDIEFNIDSCMEATITDLCVHNGVRGIKPFMFDLLDDLKQLHSARKTLNMNSFYDAAYALTHEMHIFWNETHCSNPLS